MNADWSFPTEVRHGAGRVVELASACADVGVRRPLLVTDPALASMGFTTSILESLSQAGLAVGVFSDVRPNPTGADVEAGVSAYSAGDHDGVIALGGGSALDAGKVIAFMSGQTGSLWDFEDIGDHWTTAAADAIAPVIAVPTAAGTGSEVGRAGVILDEHAGRKVIVFHPRMLPAVVICDPELTVGLPRVITVGTGMDALSHSLEALCAPGYHPMAEGIALEGVRLVLENLPRVAAEPDDLEARGHMMSAAAMGAVAFQKGLGAMHALSHPIGARFGTHHGMTNAVLMPYVLHANRAAIGAVTERLCRYAGIEGGLTGLIDHVLDLRDRLDVPHTLVDLGVDPSARADVVAGAVIDPSAAGNPIPFDSDLAGAVFDAACRGDVG
ncbi:MAG: iron-containing alcohol dehydrogenase [Acidimicrobiales bacterium]